MAVHEVDIWNRALSLCGHKRLVLEAVKTVSGITAVKFPVASVAAHGYSDADRVLLMDMDEMVEVNGRVFEVYAGNAGDFELRYEDGTGYTAETTGGEVFKLPDTKAARACHDAWPDVRDEVLRAGAWNVATKRARLARLESATTITGATAANPVVITSNAHNYDNGDLVLLEGFVGGMTELNGRWFMVQNEDTNTYELAAENGTTHAAYSSGGTAKKADTPFVPDSEYGYRYTLPTDCMRPLGLVDSRRPWVVEGEELLTDEGITVPFRYVRKLIDPTKYDATLVQAMAARLALAIAEEVTQSNTKLAGIEKAYDRILAQANHAEGQEQSPMHFEEDDWVLSRY